MDISLQWTPNSEPDVAGYKVYYREQSQPYNYNAPYWETIEPKCTRITSYNVCYTKLLRIDKKATLRKIVETNIILGNLPDVGCIDPSEFLIV